MNAADQVPFTWPREWKDGALLELLEGTPFNCLLVPRERNAVQDAARRRNLAVFEAPPPEVSAIDGVWPGIRMSERGRRDEAESGPTGAPWIDSNGWQVLLARARSPKPVWVTCGPDAAAAPPGEQDYLLAVADVAAAGGRWVASLHPAHAAALAGRAPEAAASWKALAAAAAFFQQHRQWSDWPPAGPLAVISDFAGGNEFLATEVLNLAARRNLLYRVVDRSSAAKVPAVPAALYCDKEPPAPALKSSLEAFVKSGGVLIAPASVAKAFGGAPAESPVPGYDVWRAGKGRVAAPREDWSDPFLLAADAHILMSRRHDPVRIFNASSLGVYFSQKGAAALVQLVNFPRRAAARDVTLSVTGRWRTARFLSLEKPAAQPLPPVPAGRAVEFHLPPFALYAAVELVA